jgi:hypothetical protein
MMRRIVLLVLTILLWASLAEAQPTLSTISGVIYRPNGAVCSLCSFNITKSRKGGVVLSTTPVPVPADINGVVSFTAVQGSIITVSGNFFLGSYQFAGGKELFVPNSPTASFASLKSPEDTLDTLIGAPGGGATTALNNLAAVAINTTLVSDTDNTDDLGTNAIRWKNLYLAGYVGDGAGNPLLAFNPVAGGVNRITIGNNSATNNPTLNPIGDDGSIGVTSTQKGTGTFVIESGSGASNFIAATIQRTNSGLGFHFVPTAAPGNDPQFRLASQASFTTALFNEAAGAIASLSINASQAGIRDNAVAGGIFRLDTRTGVGGLVNGEQSFVVYGIPTGGNSPIVRFVSSLQDGNTLFNPNGGTTGVGITTAAAEQFNVTSLAATRVAASINSAANSTIDLINWNHNVSATNSIANVATLDSRSNGSAATGFGHSITHTLETTAQNARPAAVESVLWTDADDGNRTSAITFSLVNSGVLGEVFRLNGNGLPAFPSTVTPGGTTGAQTINKPSGTVNFAASTSSLVVTNSLVTTNSIVFAQKRTNDTGCQIRSVVPNSGTFTINMDANCAGQTSVGWFVINQ